VALLEPFVLFGEAEGLRDVRSHALDCHADMVRSRFLTSRQAQGTEAPTGG
jgi:hypothetical protein